MKIYVNNVIDGIVHGETCFGNIHVRWIGEKPGIGKIYHIELDIADHLEWHIDITLSCNNNSSITYDEKSISLFGVIESVEDDGFTILRLGQSMVPLITRGIAFEIGSHVRVCVASVSAYEIDI